MQLYANGVIDGRAFVAVVASDRSRKSFFNHAFCRSVGENMEMKN